MGSTCLTRAEKQEAECTCHSSAPCYWCVSLDEAETDAYVSGGRAELERYWGGLDDAEDAEEGDAANDSSGGDSEAECDAVGVGHVAAFSGALRLVYVAGPFRGPTIWDIAENVRNAQRVGLEVARLGYMPVIPHANTHLFHGQGNDTFWLEGTLELLRRCDAVVLVPGWEKSSGTRAEIEEARRCGIPVFASPAEMVDVKLERGYRCQ